MSSEPVSVLFGVETEYGFTIEGRGPGDQVDDAIAFVKAYPGACFAGWDYRYESPRQDLRGFTLDRLAIDPNDAQHDSGKVYAPAHEIRSDRILLNGARFYNDHGHPEYATPECRTLEDLVLHDKAGELVLLEAARTLAATIQKPVKVYKNNSDFHGSSYGTHESYLAPRDLGFEKLFPALTPMLIARQILSGAGKVGSETGDHVDFQVSNRADFFVEPANAETLWRRPVFNTRDECHANPANWIRVHVISGDANMIPGNTRRKVGLIQLAVELAIKGEAPKWDIPKPVQAFQQVSRDEARKFVVPLQGQNWTTAYEIIESYLAAAEAALDLREEQVALIAECRTLMSAVVNRGEEAAFHIDWCAKQSLIQLVMESEGLEAHNPALRSYDLAYHDIDPDEGLYFALAVGGAVEGYPELTQRLDCLTEGPVGTRGWVRGIAVSKFGSSLRTAAWRSLSFEVDGRHEEVFLDPEKVYPAYVAAAEDVLSFISQLRSL